MFVRGEELAQMEKTSANCRVGGSSFVFSASFPSLSLYIMPSNEPLNKTS